MLPGPKPYNTTGSTRSTGDLKKKLSAADVLPALSQHLQDTKHQYGWTHETLLPDGSVEMPFFIGSLPYLATWLLPYAGAITLLEPRELQQQLGELAQRAYDFFVSPNKGLT